MKKIHEICWSDEGFSYPYKIWSDGKYIFVSYDLKEPYTDKYSLRSYLFNGIKLNLTDETNGSTSRKPGLGITSDGNHLYHLNPLAAFTFIDEKFQKITSIETVFNYAINCDENYIYTIDMYDALNIYEFKNNNFNLITFEIIEYFSGNYTQNLIIKDNNIFIAKGDLGLKILSFNETNETIEISTKNISNPCSDVCKDDTYIYAAIKENENWFIYALSYTGDAFTGDSLEIINKFEIGISDKISLSYSDNKIFVGSYGKKNNENEFKGIKVLNFDGTDFNLLESTNINKPINDIFTVNNTIFVSEDETNKIGVFKYSLIQPIPNPIRFGIDHKINLKQYLPDILS